MHYWLNYLWFTMPAEHLSLAIKTIHFWKLCEKSLKFTNLNIPIIYIYIFLNKNFAFRLVWNPLTGATCIQIFWRERPVNTSLNWSFIGPYKSQIVMDQRPDCGYCSWLVLPISSFYRSWTSPVPVFFWLWDWTYKRIHTEEERRLQEKRKLAELEEVEQGGGRTGAEMIGRSVKQHTH